MVKSEDNFGVGRENEPLAQDVSLKHCIEKVIEVKKLYNLSSAQNRYVDKRTRELMRIQLPRVPKKLPDFLNPPEIYKLLEAAAEKDANDALIVEFLIFTGLRVSEVTSLLVQYIDFNNNQLKVVQGKGSKDRYVPITNNLLHKVRLYLRGRTTGYVFCKRNGKKYSTRAIQKKVSKYIRACEFAKKLSTHSLRHTFACLCLAKGMRLEDIKLLMGHSSVKTTEIYAKLELGSVKQQFLQLMGGV